MGVGGGLPSTGPKPSGQQRWDGSGPSSKASPPWGSPGGNTTSTISVFLGVGSRNASELGW